MVPKILTRLPSPGNSSVVPAPHFLGIILLISLDPHDPLAVSFSAPLLPHPPGTLDPLSIFPVFPPSEHLSPNSASLFLSH